MVSPGPVEFEGGNWEMIKGTQPKFYDWAIKQIPNGRMGSAEEIARRRREYAAVREEARRVREG